METKKPLPEEQAVKSNKVEEAAAVFARLSDEQKEAIIKLVKCLLEQNK